MAARATARHPQGIGGICRRGAYDLMPFSLLNPAYWILHSIAGWRALWQLVVNPSHWEKTPHRIVHGPDAHAAKS